MSLEGFEGVEIIVERHLGDVTEPLWTPPVGSSTAPPATAAAALLIADGVARSPPAGQQQPLSTAAGPSSYLDVLLTTRHRQRVVGFIGGGNHGKSRLMSILAVPPADLLQQTRQTLARAGQGAAIPSFRSPTGPSPPQDCPHRLCTTRPYVTSTIASGITTKTSQLLTLVDVPGRSELEAEARAGIRAMDCAVVCVDSVEGLLPHAEQQLRYAALEMPGHVVLAITKIDRLVVELRLPPETAYEKLLHIVDSVNVVLASCNSPQLTPEQLVFTSAKYHVAFSLDSVARMYAVRFPTVNPTTLRRRLWRPYYFDANLKMFVAEAPPNSGRRGATAVATHPPAFLAFVLVPFFKAMVGALASPNDADVTLHEALFRGLQQTYGSPRDVLADVICATAPDAASLPDRPRRLALTTAAVSGGASTTLVAECAFIVTVGGSSYLATRVLSGRLVSGRRVKACWRSDVADICTVQELFIVIDNELVPRTEIAPGVICLVAGDALLARFDRTLILVDEDADPPVFAVPTLGASFARVSVEPARPQDLSKFKDALRTMASRYPTCSILVEETGEHLIQGSSEFALDVALFDLRRNLLDTLRPVAGRNANARIALEVNISDPYVAFTESVAAPQGLLRTATATDVRLEMTAGVLAPALGRRLASAEDDGAGWITAEMTGAASLKAHMHGGLPKSVITERLRSEFGWDKLAAHGWLAFGPNASTGGCSLVNDTLEDTLGAQLPTDILTAAVQGFRFATRRGPLCGEPMRDIRFSLIDASIVGYTDLPDHRAAAAAALRPVPRAIVASATALTRQLVASTFLSAAPTLLEPIVSIDVLVPLVRVPDVEPIVQRRRGVVHGELYRIPATPLCMVRCIMPLADSYGFETELRLITRGEAQLSTRFDHWAAVPGDPLDESIVMRPLQAAHGYQLARDFVLKTRRRKGLSATVELQ